MDKLDRKLVQLKIERMALKKEKDKASKARLYLDGCISTGKRITLVLGEERFNIDYIQYAKKDVVVNNLMEGKSLLNQSI
jgi:hypothetical protein